ncbi:MAG: hypothetical protein AABX33_07920 [Nanoarchaeota archaeon]
MNKKGQSISINTIIIAAIALAVLVVLFLIFTGRLNLFSVGLNKAASCQQACEAAGYKSSNPIPETDSCSGEWKPLQGYYTLEGGNKQKCCCKDNY